MKKHIGYEAWGDREMIEELERRGVGDDFDCWGTCELIEALRASE